MPARRASDEGWPRCSRVLKLPALFFSREWVIPARCASKGVCSHNSSLAGASGWYSRLLHHKRATSKLALRV